MFWLSSDSNKANSSPLRFSVHVPVLQKEVLHYLACGSNKTYLDLTVGGGGHAQAILNKTGPKGILIGSDRDPKALARASKRLEPFGQRVQLLQGSMADVEKTIEASNVERIDGVLIDCGLSKDQLEDAERGFSFQIEGPLDMRMDQTRGRTAIQWLARVTERELANAIFQFGQERYSRRIAKAIVHARKQRKLKTTLDLANVVRAAIPRGVRSSRIDPATRTFQAIRIMVNQELVQLECSLKKLFDLLSPGTRIAVISFHSLEDRIVKEWFRKSERNLKARILTKKPVRPSEQENLKNPHSRSARLRACEVLGGCA